MLFFFFCNSLFVKVLCGAKDKGLFWVSLSWQTSGQSCDPWGMIFNEGRAMDSILIWAPPMPRAAPQGNSANYSSCFGFTGGLVLWWKSAVHWTLLMTEKLKLKQMTEISWLHVYIQKTFPSEKQNQRSEEMYTFLLEMFS